MATRAGCRAARRSYLLGLRHGGGRLAGAAVLSCLAWRCELALSVASYNKRCSRRVLQATRSGCRACVRARCTWSTWRRSTPSESVSRSSSPSPPTTCVSLVFEYFIHQHRYNAVKTVKSRTVSTGQKGSKNTYNCPRALASCNCPVYLRGTKVCRYSWHSAGSPGGPFSVLKYKRIFFEIKHTEAVISNSTRKPFGLKLAKC